MHKTVKLGGRRLIETRLRIKSKKADRFQKAQRADCVCVGGIFRRIETHCHVRLRTKIIDLIGLHLLQYSGKVRRVGQIPIMQFEARIVDMWVLVDVVDPLRVE